uniref:DUF5703_N domain-containing protein n=1 Tax=Macrostomum lignano TaxID=282301 RepID=A0A1I8F4T2_9PLAT
GAIFELGFGLAPSDYSRSLPALPPAENPAAPRAEGRNSRSRPPGFHRQQLNSALIRWESIRAPAEPEMQRGRWSAAALFTACLIISAGGSRAWFLAPDEAETTTESPADTATSADATPTANTAADAGKVQEASPEHRRIVEQNLLRLAPVNSSTGADHVTKATGRRPASSLAAISNQQATDSGQPRARDQRLLGEFAAPGLPSSPGGAGHPKPEYIRQAAAITEPPDAAPTQPPTPPMRQIIDCEVLGAAAARVSAAAGLAQPAEVLLQSIEMTFDHGRDEVASGSHTTASWTMATIFNFADGVPELLRCAASLTRARLFRCKKYTLYQSRCFLLEDAPAHCELLHRTRWLLLDKSRVRLGPRVTFYSKRQNQCKFM